MNTRYRVVCGPYRYIISILLFLLISTGCKQQTKPNVIFILSDDQGWGDIHSHGNELLETPSLDRLILEGLEFDRFFVSPLCAPTRASLLTGRYHLKTGVTSVSNGLEIMDSDETTLAELFKSNGYATGIFGKWHNGSHAPNRPEHQGFNEFIGFCAGHLTNYFNSPLDSLQHEINSSGYITDYLTNKAIDFIQRNRRRPFFCYIPYNTPHSPYQLPDQYFEKYKSKGLDDTLSAVYGMVDNMDYNISRILNELDRSGLSRNTMVIFMSDNGPNGIRYNGHMKGIKGQVDEGGVRVPCMIRWPGKIQAGKKLNNLASHLDWYPTLLSLCGLSAITSKPIDGIDLSASLLLENSLPDRVLYTHVAFLEKDLKDKPGAIRTSQYRITMKSAETAYYDMSIDPYQKNDLYPTDSTRIIKYLNSYRDWFIESSKDYKSTKPIEVDHSYVELPTYEASFKGSLRYAEGHGWAHDWLKDWTTVDDEMTWLITSARDQELSVSLKYTCPAQDTGSIIQISILNYTATSRISIPFDPPLLPSPDRIIRKESYEKEWATMPIGIIKIPAGIHLLKLKATKVNHHQVAEIKSILLRR